MNRILAEIALIAIAWFGGTWYGEEIGRMQAEANIEKQLADAVETARIVERRNQETANNELRRQANEMAGINAGLRDDIERLRDRPARTVPATARADCAGGNGAELAREHAEFLARYAALAAETDAALSTCYAVYDAVREGVTP